MIISTKSKRSYRSCLNARSTDRYEVDIIVSAGIEIPVKITFFEIINL